ncbi:type I-E CRISPR-associated protein Cse1/CasA [Chromobacterium sp. S0633]|uniref:type I-E CRISPR-associated protein Cse1/CasA n=1 Tax=Chromobacterium sp. S0633 TaxID=2957805 RepID=UPI00209FD7FC|nr:type I-E CRISPR-associated protein Cse1/CasA [Chromobacterium sp. S0633]MCP1292733.1 type I-E CRISPR-associated protein Cse1/CasA [Chromobacterium sp. S0633]
MNKTINLLDAAWLPVRYLDGRVAEIGLVQLFADADRIAALADTAPPSLLAEYRLLLAILNRALRRGFGRWDSADLARGYREGLPVAAIHDYLEHWRGVFNLFDPQRPFMQVAALAQDEATRDKAKPWSQISLASSIGNSPVLFDHSIDSQPSAIPAAEALRHLLGFLQFTPGGLVKTLRDSDKAGPLANTAASLPVGQTLAQTLLLALHPSGPDDDLPAWEKLQPTIAQLRAEPTLASGHNDRYTRLSRAVLLLPEPDGVTVRQLRFAAGLALADNEQAPDAMASYRMGVNNMVRLSFGEGRAFWRDLGALLPPNPADDKAHSLAAATLGWARHLQHRLGQTEPLSVMILGLSSNQAKLERWRAERFELPQRVLEQAEGAEEVRGKLREAEELYSKLRLVMAGMLAAVMPDPGHKDTRGRARAQLDAGPAPAAYFSALESRWPQLLERIGAEALEHADAYWRDALRRAAKLAWDAACRQLGGNAAALKALALAEPGYLALIRPLTQASTQEENNHV